MKTYKNFSEQVEQGTSNITLFDGEINENVWECWASLIMDKTTNETYADAFEMTIKEFEQLRDVDRYELIDEYAFNILESVYQVYQVEFSGNYTEIQENLLVTWDDTNNCYLMPVSVMEFHGKW